jgi:hypothetical protein|tara:strand:- start:648 stop:869 length:222 start_codon:yes stop_codon:yes gene_type:complete
MSYVNIEGEPFRISLCEDIAIGDGRVLLLNLTHEGIVMDVFAKEWDESLEYAEQLGKVTMTYKQWANWVEGES